ncbi:calcium/proton exchanger [Cladochytrium replicatum]|nr:calcium/proton exchanger [Cladochytrium replicatum]
MTGSTVEPSETIDVTPTPDSNDIEKKSLSSHHPPPTFASSIRAVVFASWLNVLIVFSPLGIVAANVGWSDTVVFCLNFIALLPLAKLLGTATEEIALRTNQIIGGLLNATFGNLVELLVAVLALRDKLVLVVQASLLGSILSNMLLVLGFAFLTGGIKYSTQKFNATAAQTSASMFTVTVLAILVPAALGWQLSETKTSPENIEHLITTISRGTAIILLVLYILYLLFQLRTHVHLFTSTEEETEQPQMTPLVAGLLLVLATGMVALNAEYLVGSIEGISKAWNLSKTFVGLIMLPIVGNAAEHVTALTVAMKNKMDLAISIAIGSSVQIALFVTPFCVIVGWGLGVNMTLAFGALETAIVFVAVFVTNSLIVDGESNWLEGAMLIGAYLIVAIAFYLLPDNGAE